MKRGDVVLMYVPFVGKPGGKLRPALVVQNDLLNKLLPQTVLVEITSKLTHVDQPHQVRVELGTPDGIASGLKYESAIQCERLHTVPQKEVRRIIGSLSPKLMQQVDAALQSALGVKVN